MLLSRNSIVAVGVKYIMESDSTESMQFIVTAISDEDLETFQEVIEAKDMLDAQAKFQEMWPLASVTSIQRA